MNEAATETSAARVAALLGEDGALARELVGYEPRPAQVEMAERVALALQRGERLVVEAATGTGKTLAYLIPAILSGKKTVVSTATKNLQEQILEKDIPLLARFLPREFRAVALKGRQNYLCLWNYEAFRQEPRFRQKADVAAWPSIERWVERTQTGDRAELDSLPDDWPTWSDLSMGSDACLGRTCPQYGECFVTRARTAALEADVVVVNHHLFFADLALRTNADATLLPAYRALVFDEAHNLEETASSYFGVQVSTFRYTSLLGDVRKLMTRERALSEAVVSAASGVGDRAKAFFGELAALVSAEGRVEAAGVFEAGGEALDATWRALEGRLVELRAAIVSAANAGEVGQRLADRVEAILQETAMLVERDATDLVYVVERRGRGVFLSATPIDLSAVFRDVLYGTCDAQIYTSATLTTDGDFRFFRQRMGLPEGTQELRLEPVFDYMDQALLYVPDDLPDPSDPQFVERVAPTMRRLVELCDGRAFLLFTSYRNMREAHRLLAPQLDQPVLMQGEMGRSALLEAFRSDVRSVLFATSSFWEGVDVQGEALSLVIIDKLPFGSPGDPLLKARLALLERDGGVPFRDYQIPAAAITLKQGFGRLIRHRHDFGIIAILDGRLIRRGYGRRFIDSLPRARRTRDIALVERWWRSRSQQSSERSEVARSVNPLAR